MGTRERMNLEGLEAGVVMELSVRRFASFKDEQKADREWWAAMSPDARVALVEELRQEWARIRGQPIEGLRRTARVLQRDVR
jgi:hypothetical protein